MIAPPSGLARVFVGAAAACALVALGPGCGAGTSRSGGASGSGRGAGPPRIVGTTLAADTGTALPGVEVVAPGGRRARSGLDGRFELADLEEGLEGPLVGTGPDGRQGEVRLRPLRRGKLEVVIHLRRP